MFQSSYNQLAGAFAVLPHAGHQEYDSQGAQWCFRRQRLERDVVLERSRFVISDIDWLAPVADVQHNLLSVFHCRQLSRADLFTGVEIACCVQRRVQTDPNVDTAMYKCQSSRPCYDSACY